jgi:uncharacterized phage protein (TIGR01671 family)
MNREIKFRGFDLIANGWVFGGICFDADIKGKVYITTNYNEMIEVDPKSIGQFTGLPDKNKIDIYEGDIIKANNDKNMTVAWDNKVASVVLFREGWMFKHYFCEGVDADDCEIIGNIYETEKQKTEL